MAKDSFIIYTAFYRPISLLSDKQLGRLFRAIFAYNLGEVVNVEEDIRMAFEFFKNQFDIDESKYQAKIKRDVENGRKGGNPNFKRGQSNPYYNRKKDNDKVGLQKITQDNPGLSEITEDKAINDNVNDNVLNKSFPNIKDSSDGDAPDEQPQENSKSEIDFSQLETFFNETMVKSDAVIPKIQKLTDKRKTVVRARCREYGKEAIMQVILNASKSSFLNGGGSQGFKADFDWLFRPNNFPKVLEGNYNDNKNANRTDNQRPQSGLRSKLPPEPGHGLREN